MINIKGLHKYYKNNGETVHALNGICLEMDSKGFVVLLGKSGCGKSTFLNIIGGLESFDEGEILISGITTKNFKHHDWDAYRNTYVGFVFQEYYIIETFTVGKNISLALELQGYPKEEIVRRVDDILKQVDLDRYQDRYPNELSGGQKQRIAIARALTKDPQIILADEPTGNLDSETGKIVLDTLKTISETKLVIMVTHDHDFAHLYGDRIIEMKDGEIFNDFLNNKNKEEFFLENGDNKYIIQLPKGKELHQETIDHINDILLRGDKDFCFTFSNKAYIKEQAMVKKESTHVYKEIIDKTKTLALKKSALPFKNALHLSLNSMVKRKRKLLLTLILFVFSLLFVGISSNFSFYNIAKVTNLTYQTADKNEIPLVKLISSGSSITSFTSQDFIDLDEEYTDIQFSKIYREIVTFNDIVETYEASQYDDPYYTKQFNYVGIYEKRLPLALLIGQYPQENEFLLTDYMAEMLVYYQVFPDIQSMNELIGKQFVYNNHNLLISGIIKTDYHKYDYLKQLNYLGNHVMQSGFNYELYNILYMNEKTYN